jgi:hypothetical protein
VLLSSFLKGWSILITNHGECIREDDEVYTVPEFLWYRFFEQNFEITSKLIVSHNADLQLPSMGMLDLQQELLQELSNVAVSAAEVQNEYLTQRLAKMLIEAGLGFDNDQWTRKQIISGLDEISSTNECGQLAVQRAVFELQKPAEVNDDEDLMPISAPWVLNLIQYTFDEQEGFIETVGQIETEMTSVETEQD